MAFHYSPKIVNSGLILYIDAANNRSIIGTNSIYDISNTQNTLVPYNNISLVSDHLYFRGAGPTGTTTSNVDYIYVGGTNSSYCNLSQLTLEAWCNPDITNDYQYLFSNSRDVALTPGLNGYELFIRNGQARFQIANNGVVFATATSTLIPINTWSHIAATYDGLDLKVYVNGILKITANSSMGIGIPSTAEMCIGRMGYHPGAQYYAYQGDIDISRIYNRALSSSDLLQNYNSLKSRFGL